MKAIRHFAEGLHNSEIGRPLRSGEPDRESLAQGISSWRQESSAPGRPRRAQAAALSTEQNKQLVRKLVVGRKSWVIRPRSGPASESPI